MCKTTYVFESHFDVIQRNWNFPTRCGLYKYQYSSNFWNYSHFLLFFYWFLYKWPSQCFPRVFKGFWRISKNLKFVPSKLRVQPSIFAWIVKFLTISFNFVYKWLLQHSHGFWNDFENSPKYWNFCSWIWGYKNSTFW